MIAPLQPFFTDYEMIAFQNSFRVFLGFLVIPTLANLVVYLLGLRKRKPEESLGRVLGRSTAVVGGLITLFGVALPLGSVDSANPALADTYLGLLRNGGWIVLVFGLLWFAFFAVPKKVAAIWGLAWGGLALVFILVAVQGLVDTVGQDPGAVYLHDGVLVTILGSLLLILGSTLAYIKAGRTSRSGPIRLNVATPPTP